MLDEAAVAADINRLQSLEHSGVDMDGLLLDLGRVVELKHAIAAAKWGSTVPVRAFSAMDVADVAQLARRQLRAAIDAVRRFARFVKLMSMHVQPSWQSYMCLWSLLMVGKGGQHGPCLPLEASERPMTLSIRHISFTVTPL